MDLRKTSLLNHDLDRLNVDIAALSETRLPDSCSIKESIYTIFWYGRPQEQKREQSADFAIANSIIPFCETTVVITTRLMSSRVHTSKGPLMIFSVYALTLQADDEVKNDFYQLLEQEIEKVPRTERIIILGDFNARVGRAFDSWNGILGKHGVGNMNDNGQLVMELCASQNLSITNTFFEGKISRQESWKHPRSGHWHQLDLVLRRRCNLKEIQHTRSYKSAECDTDHSLVGCRVIICVKKMYRKKTPCHPRINMSEINDKQKCKKFNNETTKLRLALTSVNEACCILRDGIYNAAFTVFGRSVKKNVDWFEENSLTLLPLVNEKRTALLTCKTYPNNTKFANGT